MPPTLRRRSKQIQDAESFLYTGQSWRDNHDIPGDVTHVRVVDPSVKRIGQDAFPFCRQLINVELCEGLVHIDRGAFYQCTSLKSINFPSTVKVIGTGAFGGCSQLINVELSERLVRIDDSAFKDCTSLTSIRIPSTVKVISKKAFQGCTQLMNVELCEGQVCIDNWAFADCTSLTSIRIPSTVKSTRKNAFSRCERLLAIEFCEEIEQFVHEVSLPWWNHGKSKVLLRTYSFLARRNIPSRLDAIHFQTWKDNIHNMFQRIPEEPCKESYFALIESRLANYEHLQDEVAPILELALWKAKMEEQSKGKYVDAQIKFQCRYNSLSMVPIIIPNVLSFL